MKLLGSRDLRDNGNVCDTYYPSGIAFTKTCFIMVECSWFWCFLVKHEEILLNLSHFRIHGKISAK